MYAAVSASRFESRDAISGPPGAAPLQPQQPWTLGITLNADHSLAISVQR